ncbi:addiction module antidote protein [Sphingomonas oryzagri]|uniref:Addiction module antidote protein n=1 Tax=Sphingomonas oryzagri TaxID=3042314 RepID=A0ABT6N7T6_9SPHN|nr:addiction module antidote protein [Sphingomonas oryzagri]MDH7641145.1 putative addiction module antidote protein [Sphingomonas oryzagri]
MTIELTRFDAAEFLTDPEDQAELIADAFGTGDAGYIKHALAIVAKARGMTQVERDTGIKRQALYRALGKDGNPTLDTLLKLTHSLGFTLRAERTAQA